MLYYVSDVTYDYVFNVKKLKVKRGDSEKFPIPTWFMNINLLVLYKLASFI